MAGIDRNHRPIWIGKRTDTPKTSFRSTITAKFKVFPLTLIPQSQYALRCEAFEDCTIGSIKPKTLIELFSATSYEAFLRAYVAVFHPSRAAYIHCVGGIGVDVRRRLAMELLNLADRFGAADPRGISITLNLSHELLDSLVGASRQQVTEYLNEFDHDRIIFRDGRRIIIDPEKLQKILKVVA